MFSLVRLCALVKSTFHILRINVVTFLSTASLTTATFCMNWKLTVHLHARNYRQIHPESCQKSFSLWFSRVPMCSIQHHESFATLNRVLFFFPQAQQVR